MYVCICRQITDNQIRDLCRDGASNMNDLRAKLGVASECGKCGKLAQTIVKEFHKIGSYTNAAQAVLLFVYEFRYPPPLIFDQLLYIEESFGSIFLAMGMGLLIIQFYHLYQ